MHAGKIKTRQARSQLLLQQSPSLIIPLKTAALSELLCSPPGGGRGVQRGSSRPGFQEVVNQVRSSLGPQPGCWESRGFCPTQITRRQNSIWLTSRWSNTEVTAGSSPFSSAALVSF